MYYEKPRIPGAARGRERDRRQRGQLRHRLGRTWTTARWKKKWQSVLPAPCDVKTTCPDNDPEQTDVPPYEIVTE